MELEQLKKDGESYDEVLSRVLAQQKKKSIREQMIEGYKINAKRDLALAKEWEHVSAEIKE